MIALTIRSLSDLELKIKISHTKHYMQSHNIKSWKRLFFFKFFQGMPQKIASSVTHSNDSDQRGCYQKCPDAEVPYSHQYSWCPVTLVGT